MPGPRRLPLKPGGLEAILRAQARRVLAQSRVLFVLSPLQDIASIYSASMGG